MTFKENDRLMKMLIIPVKIKKTKKFSGKLISRIILMIIFVIVNKYSIFDNLLNPFSLFIRYLKENLKFLVIKITVFKLKLLNDYIVDTKNKIFITKDKVC